MNIKRAVRVAEVLKRELVRIIFKETKDPDIKLVTITDVKITDDLKIAKIYFTTLTNFENRDKVSDALNRASSFIRSEIAKAMTFKYVPELHFSYDKVADYADNIEKLIFKIKNEEE